MQWKYLLEVLIIICIFIMKVTGRRRSYDITYVYMDIMTAEQFDDTVIKTDGSNTIAKPTFLILYKDECYDQIGKLGIHPKILPPPQNCNLLKYEYVETPKHIWYQEKDLLHERYPPVDCLTVYYLPMGMPKFERPIRWEVTDEKNGFKNWAWRHLLTAVTVKNKLREKWIMFKTQNGGGEDKNYIGEGETAVFYAYPSDYMYIFNDAHGDEFYAGRVIYGPSFYSIDESFPEVEGENIQSWENRVFDIEKKRIDIFSTLVWTNAHRTLLTLKQPLITPNFTEIGYKKLKTPEVVQNLLTNHYKTYESERYIEPMGVDDSVLNTIEKHTSFVGLHLEEKIKPTINELMLPFVESWCNCKLKATFHYGIREYYNGHVLRMHVDRIDTHIISIIFQIYRELEGKPDWPLEVYHYNGTRSTVYLKAGEMLLYESAKLIHGRPQPFQGKLYANSFLHYVPIDPVWPLKYEDDFYVHEKLGLKESGITLRSPLSLAKSILKPTRDEL